MLGLLNDRLPDDALYRLADPTALWTVATTLDTEGRRCWLGHAQVRKMDMDIGYHFDDLCNRFGLTRTVRACRMRAEREMSRRGLVPQERNVNEGAVR